MIDIFDTVGCTETNWYFYILFRSVALPFCSGEPLYELRLALFKLAFALVAVLFHLTGTAAF